MLSLFDPVRATASKQGPVMGHMRRRLRYRWFMAPKQRRAGGTLYWTKAGWRARMSVTVDGERVKKAFDLGTKDRAAAEAKLRRLVAEGVPQQGPAYRFRAAALDIVEESKIRSKANRLGRLRNHVFPHIGDMDVGEIRATHIWEILEGLAKRELSLDLVSHVKTDINAVLSNLWRRELISENVCARIDKLPDAPVCKKQRAVLTDEEFERYLAWTHPDKRFATAVLERQTMACLSRMFGGVRIGDIRALDWDELDTEEGRFLTGWAPRQKNDNPQLLNIPEMLRPFLRDWWKLHGEPESGPVFPTRKGPRAGEAKGRTNVAADLRKDLVRAFGIEVPEWRESVRSNGRTDRRLVWVEGRSMSKRDRELFTDAYYKPVDFHSFRRGYKRALATAGLDVQEAMHLSGSSDLKAHQRYLRDNMAARDLPEAALPKLDMNRVQEVKQKVVDQKENPGENQGLGGGRSRDRTCDFNRVKDEREGNSLQNRPKSVDVGQKNTENGQSGHVSEAQIRADVRVSCPARAQLVNADPVEQALAEAVALASQAGQWGVVATLAAELEGRRRDRAGVTDLESARRKKKGLV